MKKDKILLSIILVMIISLALVFSACADNTETGADTASGGKTTIRIGASPDAVPLAESGVASLEAMGYQVEVVPFDDFFVPNVALDEGSIDTNFYQHRPFLDNYNQEKGTNIQMVMPLYNFYYCIYSRQADSIEDIPENGQFGIANDAANLDHCLRIMDQVGLIKLTDEKKDMYNILDIAENPTNLDFVQLDYVQRVAIFDNLAGMENASNTQFMSGLNPMEDVLYKEVNNDYALGLCINANTDSTDDQWVKDMIAAYTSDASYQHVMDYFQGAYAKCEEFEALSK